MFLDVFVQDNKNNQKKNLNKISHGFADLYWAAADVNHAVAILGSLYDTLRSEARGRNKTGHSNQKVRC